MVVHETAPFNAEPSLSVLARGEITPIGDFYSRNHGPVPKIETPDWQLSVNGLVDRELTLSYDELTSRFEAHTLIATLQCAGNRRAGFNEIEEIEGEDPWGGGATSTAEWRGARLADILAAAGVSCVDDLHVAFEAPDVSKLASPPQEYGSSIPLDKALSPEVLLAWEMNGEPLPEIHGGPVRVVVPGYIGARSVKWLKGITVQNEPSDNYFQAQAYHVLPADADPETTDPSAGISLSSIALNSEILVPEDGATVSAGRQTLRGYAFAGDARLIERVDVSLDGGESWEQADLQEQPSPWSWRMWSYEVDLAPGEVHILARAWDSSGAMQPESAAELWNPKGYANNSWPKATVHVCE